MKLALDIAVREARRIRRNLVRARGDIQLGGDCGLASVLLAAAICDPGSLRCVSGWHGWHAWNVVDATIIDITATQFNDHVDGPIARGVLVTDAPRPYHRGDRTDRVRGGESVLRNLCETMWYESDPYAEARINDASEILWRFVAREKRAMP